MAMILLSSPGAARCGVYNQSTGLPPSSAGRHRALWPPIDKVYHNAAQISSPALYLFLCIFPHEVACRRLPLRIGLRMAGLLKDRPLP